MFKKLATAAIVAMASASILAAGADAAPTAPKPADAVTMNAAKAGTPVAKHHKRHKKHQKHHRHSKQKQRAAAAAASPAPATPAAPVK